jgi:lysophospholipase L1-like esterase
MNTIVALGDSTTAGTPGFRSPLEAPPHGTGNPESQFSYWLAAMHPEWRVLNRGVNGDRTDHIDARFLRDVVGENADLAIVIAGVNDIYQGRSPASVQHGLERIYTRAQQAGRPIRLVAGSIIPFNTASAAQNASMHAVNRWIRDYCPAHPEIGFCDTRLAVAMPGDPDRLVSSPDDLHPSPEGYKLMARALEPVIQRMLRREQPLL